MLKIRERPTRSNRAVRAIAVCRREFADKRHLPASALAFLAPGSPPELFATRRHRYRSAVVQPQFVISFWLLDPMIDHFVLFCSSWAHHDKGFSTAELKEFARRIRTSIEQRGYDVGELFGSSTDLWAFEILFDDFTICVSLSPELKAAENSWSAQVHLEDPGWVTETRTKRLETLNRVDRAVHEVLTRDLGATNIEWFVDSKGVRRGSGVQAP